MATAALCAEAAAAAGEERRPRKWNGERGAVRVGAGEVKARAGLPWPHARGAPATRGVRWLHAARKP